MERALVIMARHPEPGRVKTRLAEHIGAGAACALYRAFLDDLRARFADADCDLIWAFTPDDAPFSAVVGADAHLVPQGDGTLDVRMARVFARLLAAHAHVVMIGADVPHVPAAWLADAFAGLRDADIVLGPAEDGGYYLVGMSAAYDLFTGVPMGTDRVYAATRARARALQLEVAEVPMLFDVDREEDVLRLPEFALAHPEVRLDRTMAVLRRGEEEGWKIY